MHTAGVCASSHMVVTCCVCVVETGREADMLTQSAAWMNLASATQLKEARHQRLLAWSPYVQNQQIRRARE